MEALTKEGRLLFIMKLRGLIQIKLTERFQICELLLSSLFYKLPYFFCKVSLIKTKLYNIERALEMLISDDPIE